MKKNNILFFIFISFLFQTSLFYSSTKRISIGLGNTLYTHVNDILKALEKNANYFFLRALYEKIREPLFHIGKPLTNAQKGRNAPKEAEENLNSLRSYYHKIMMNAHDRFYRYNYRPWKASLSDEKRTKYENAIKSYEQAYQAYKTNHLSEQANDALLVTGERITSLMYDQIDSRYIAF